MPVRCLAIHLYIIHAYYLQHFYQTVASTSENLIIQQSDASGTAQFEDMPVSMEIDCPMTDSDLADLQLGIFILFINNILSMIADN